MKSKIYISIGSILLLAGAMVEEKSLIMGGIFFVLIGFFMLVAITSGIEYSESHYRFYKRVFFWKTGHWKSILGVRRIYIRHYCHVKKYSFWKSRSPQDDEGIVEYQVYFVRKSGYYKIFETDSLETAREKANVLAKKYNLVVKEKEEEKLKLEEKKITEERFIPQEELA